MILRKLLLGLVGILFSLQGFAFDEGIDYERVARPQPTETGEKIEVLELFWYACPHCFQLEPKLNKWLETKRDNVAFRRMPAVLGAHWAPQARAYYAAELLGVLDTTHEPLFYAINVEKRPLKDEEALSDFFVEKGVDKDEFRKAYNSFYVEMKVRRATELGNRFGLDSVPSFVVNGKYVTGPTLSGGSERMFEIMDYLVDQEGKSTPTEGQATPASGS